jgi:hypothetical protein
MFRPFAIKYSISLDQWVNSRMGLCRFSKREFFSVFWPAYLQSFTTKNIQSAWKKSGIWPRDSAKVVSILEPSQTSRPSTSHSGTSVVSIHAYIRARKKVRFALEGISDEMASMVGDMFEKYQFALAIAEHERDCYQRATVTEKARRQRSKPLANMAFIEKHGNRMVWDPYWMEIKEEFRIEIAAQKTAEDLAKEEAKARKQREKEQREIDNTQRKASKQALAQEVALQRKIAREAAAEERLRVRQENKRQKDAAKQLQSELNATKRNHNTKKKPIRQQKQHIEVVDVDDEDDNSGPSQPPTSSSGRLIRPRKHFEPS